MDSWLEIGLIVASLLSATAAFVWVALKVGSSKSGSNHEDQDYSGMAEREVEHLFNDEFREELRNRGRLHFEKIIGENAMFLQQDMRLTTSEINEFMKQEITKTLKDAFGKYESSISDAKDQALESMQKTQSAVEEQRELMTQQLAKEIDAEKQRILGSFHENMADVVNHYVLAAIGNQISLDDQLEYILSELEQNKTAIVEDITRGT
jgi:vacuolar-type H+-ATPase subunit H